MPTSKHQQQGQHSPALTTEASIRANERDYIERLRQRIRGLAQESQASATAEQRNREADSMARAIVELKAKHPATWAAVTAEGARMERDRQASIINAAKDLAPGNEDLVKAAVADGTMTASHLLEAVVARRMRVRAGIAGPSSASIYTGRNEREVAHAGQQKKS